MINMKRYITLIILVIICFTHEAGAKVDCPAIVTAAFNGKYKLVKKSIEAGCDIDFSDKKGYTPLMWAALKGNEDIVKLLIDSGANPNTKNYRAKGITALMLATKKGNYPIVRYLVNHGANINMKTGGGMTALKIAYHQKYGKIARLLEDIQHKQKKMNKLFVAIRLGKLKKVKKFLDEGYKVEYKDEWGFTPLMIAAENGHYDIVDLLIDNGADINAKNSNGQTALSLAKKKWHVDIMRLLTESGAETDNKEKKPPETVK